MDHPTFYKACADISLALSLLQLIEIIKVGKLFLVRKIAEIPEEAAGTVVLNTTTHVGVSERKGYLIWGSL